MITATKFEYFVSDIHVYNLGRFLELCDKAHKNGYKLYSGEDDYREVKKYMENEEKYPLGYMTRHIFRREKTNEKV